MSCAICWHLLTKPAQALFLLHTTHKCTNYRPVKHGTLSPPKLKADAHGKESAQLLQHLCFLLRSAATPEEVPLTENGFGAKAERKALTKESFFERPAGTREGVPLTKAGFGAKDTRKALTKQWFFERPAATREGASLTKTAFGAKAGFTASANRSKNHCFVNTFLLSFALQPAFVRGSPSVVAAERILAPSPQDTSARRAKRKQLTTHDQHRTTPSTGTSPSQRHG